MEDAKEIHSCLRKAAGIFKEFKVSVKTLFWHITLRSLGTHFHDIYVRCAGICDFKYSFVTLYVNLMKKHINAKVYLSDLDWDI